jgi:hypothetical protein
MLAVIADVHATNHAAFGGVSVGRRNERCVAVEACLAAAVEVTRQRANELVVAGDLFDNDRPFPDQLRAVGEILGASDAEKHLVVGNHDQHSSTPGDNAMAPLAMLPRTAVYDEARIVDTVIGDVTFLPFHIDVLNFTPRGTVVIAHHGIADDKTPVFLRHGKGVVQVKDLFAWMNMHGVNVYIAGDWHEHKHWEKDGKHIVQCGALCPTGWNNPGHYGYGSVILTDGVTYERVVVPGPRFLYAAAPEALVKEVTKAKKRGDIPYVRAACAQFADPALEGAHIEWAPIIDRAEAGVKVAAEHMKSAGTLEECIDTYVNGSTTIPDDMKKDVLSKLHELVITGRA